MNEISTEINRLKKAKTDIKASIISKGITVPIYAKIDDYSLYIDQIGTDAKIYLKDYPTIKFGGSTFTEVPACFSLEGMTNIDNLFQQTGLLTLPKDVRSAVSAKYAFSGCSFEYFNDISFDNCKDMTGCFKDCNYISTVLAINIPAPPSGAVQNPYYLHLPNVENLTECFNNCGNLNIAEISSITPVYFNRTFMGCSSLREAHINALNATSLDWCFRGCSNLSVITIDNSSEKLKYIDLIFQDCDELTSTPDLECINLENHNDICRPFGEAFEYPGTYGTLPNLTNCGAFLHLSVSLDITPLSHIRKDSLLRIFRECGDVTSLSGRTIKLSRNILETLTEDEKAIATSKGWSLTSN